MKENNDYLNSPLGLNFEEDNILNTLENKNESSHEIIKKKFDKIIIPYNFKKNNYSVNDNEIDGYENKEFVLNTLHHYNNQNIFKFDLPYSPPFCKKILFYFLMLLIVLIILLLLFTLIIIFLFNPLIIYISYRVLKAVFSLLASLKRTIYEKLKKKAINKRLEETNKSKYCRDHKIKWNLGVSGYWIEIEKINHDAELQTVK